MFLSTALFADVQIYLYSSAVKGEEALKLKDIAHLDGSDDECAALEDLEISDVLFNDTYIDRRELSLFLRRYTESRFLICGSSVKIKREKKPEAPRIVRSGEQVKIFVKRKNITIEIMGVSVKDAGIGERVTVRCGSREISGIVNSNRTVTCEI
jgi:hypothetical protein